MNNLEKIVVHLIRSNKQNIMKTATTLFILFGFIAATACIICGAFKESLVLASFSIVPLLTSILLMSGRK